MYGCIKRSYECCVSRAKELLVTICESIQCIPQMTIVHCQATGDSKLLIILSTPIMLDKVAIEPPTTPTSQSEEIVHPAPTVAM